MQIIQPVEARAQKARPVLDDDTLLDGAAARATCGNVSTMCIWRWQRDPRVQFPAPDVVINSRRYWYAGTIRRWKAERATKVAA